MNLIENEKEWLEKILPKRCFNSEMEGTDYKYCMKVEAKKGIEGTLFITAGEREKMEELIKLFPAFSIIPVKGILVGKEAVKVLIALAYSHNSDEVGRKIPFYDKDRIAGTFFLEIPENEGEGWYLWDYLP